MIDCFKTQDSKSFKNVIHDFLLGLRYWRMWHMLGSKDIRLRYKRSKFGQIWHVLSSSIQIFFLGMVWAYLFKIPLKDFFPHLTAGKIIFELLSTIIVRGNSYYVNERSFLLGTPCPKSVFAYANTFNATLTFLYNSVVILAVILIFKIDININFLFFIPALLLIIINAVWITVALGYLGARFRDIPPLVASLMSMVMMITPILWKVSMLPEKYQSYMLFNPFYIFIKIARDPLLGLPADINTWVVAIFITFIGWITTILALRKNLYKISFWV